MYNLSTIEVLHNTPPRLKFRVTDAEGLQQAQLIVTETTDPTNICGFTKKLLNSKTFNGDPSETFAFAISPATTNATLKVMDTFGNVAVAYVSIREKQAVEAKNVARAPRPIGTTAHHLEAKDGQFQNHLAEMGVIPEVTATVTELSQPLQSGDVAPLSTRYPSRCDGDHPCC